MKNLILLFLVLMGLYITSQTSFAHYDTKDGPVVAAAIKAIEQNNINYVLVWVQPPNEKEIKDVFELAMKVRALSPEGKTLADHYFFETLVRLHRSGEGVPYTGVKPSGTPIDGKILAADKSIAVGNLSALNDLIPKEKFAELKKRFEKVMSFKDFDVNNIKTGREYVEAYVQFFHFAEEEGDHKLSHIEKSGHVGHFPWIVSGILFITTILFGTLYYKEQ